MAEELARLRSQVARYRMAFALSAPGQALVDLEGHFIEVNDSLCHLLGYTAKDLVGRRFQDITHPDDISDDARTMADMLAGRFGNHLREKRYLRPDGSTVWAQIKSRLVRNDQGQPLYFVTNIEDISDKKASEQAMREREALLSSMGKFVPGIIHKIGFDDEGRAHFLYISDRAMEMFELPHEVMERDYYAHHVRVHPDDLDYVRRLATAPKPDAQLVPSDFEYRVILPSKGERVYGGHAIPVREENGRIAWYGHTADITDKKALTEARLTARMAQEANRAKNEFLSRVSHELRTPLNAVIGFAQLLHLGSSGQLNADQLRHVEHIQAAGTHLLGIISDVLDLSRIEAGQLPLQIGELTASCILSEARTLVASQAEAAGIQLQPVQHLENIRVQADPMRLRQVLVNLLSNAVKYNRAQGSVSPRVWREGNDVAIAIDDTGLGLSAEQQAHLFEPFNRLGAERTGIEGTGIGLVIVRRLLEAMHGRLEVHSREGEGSSFIAWLPSATPAAAAQATAQADPSTTPTPAAANEPRLVVLYAEDNEVNIELVRQVLQLRPSCELHVATSGAEALVMAHTLVPDLFLLDMHLGDMTGFELADQLKQDATLRDIPRIAFSADAMPDQIHRARAHGFVGYLTKPLDVEALLDCVDERAGKQHPKMS